jgi:hypothetical protein
LSVRVSFRLLKKSRSSRAMTGSYREIVAWRF